MTADVVLRALKAPEPGVTEFYFHPAIRTMPLLEASASGYDRTGELAALTNPEVAEQVKALGLTPACFRDIS